MTLQDPIFCCGEMEDKTLHLHCWMNSSCWEIFKWEVLLKYVQELHKHTVFLKTGNFPTRFALLSEQERYFSNLQQHSIIYTKLKKKAFRTIVKTCYLWLQQQCNYTPNFCETLSSILFWWQNDCYFTPFTDVDNNFGWNGTLEIPSPTLCLKPKTVSKLVQIAQGHIQLSFKYLQGWKSCNLSGQATLCVSLFS